MILGKEQIKRNKTIFGSFLMALLLFSLISASYIVTDNLLYSQDIDRVARAAEEGSSTSQEGSSTSQEGSSTSQEGSSTSQEGSSTSQEGSSTSQEGSSTSQEGSSTSQEGSSTSQEGSSTSQDVDAITGATTLMESGNQAE